MTDRERLIELIGDFVESWVENLQQPYGIESIADYLLEDGVIVPPETGIGDVSDGYHTFNELYHHRAVLFSVICNTFKDKAWKSKKHDTGDMYDGMFIVGIETPQGQATYHYDINPYWDMFKVKELPNAPKWDGHTPEEAIRRISILQVDNVIVLPCKVGDIVYVPYKDSQTIEEKRVKSISHVINEFENSMEFNCKHNYAFLDTDINREVFFTREEAEKALKEREQNEGFNNNINM